MSSVSQDCPICYANNVPLVEWHSGHSFCQPCTDRWIARGVTCPICRDSLSNTNVCIKVIEAFGRLLDESLNRIMVGWPEWLAFVTRNINWQYMHEKNEKLIHDPGLRDTPLKFIDLIQTELSNDVTDQNIADRLIVMAAARNIPELIQRLLDSGIITDVYRGYGVSEAAYNAHWELLPQLLGNTPIPSRSRGTAICRAAATGRRESLELLFRNGAISNPYLQKAIQLAHQNGHAEIAQFLQSKL